MRIKYFCIVIGVSILSITGCGKKPSGPPPVQPVPVMVAMVEQKDVPVEFENIGTIEAYSTVSVLSQVGGLLTHVYFKEGQDVKTGDLLFKIDPQPFQALLQRAEANLQRDIAQSKQVQANLNKDLVQLTNSRQELRRVEELIKGGVVSQQEYDQKKANTDSMEATIEADRAAINTMEQVIKADKADVDNAKIQLGYCTIRSPVDGRTGNLMVNQGNVVKASDKPLVVINKITPIYVSFTAPENYLFQIKKFMALKKLVVTAILPNDTDNPIVGEITFVDNAVDRNTGSIRLKGTFENKEHRLWPGQFVNIVLKLTVEPNRMVIPTEAIQNGQKGQYVYIVKKDQTVELRPVVIAQTYEHVTVIETGVTSGETVVTDGQLRLIPGTKVEIKSEPDSVPGQAKG